MAIFRMHISEGTPSASLRQRRTLGSQIRHFITAIILAIDTYRVMVRDNPTEKPNHHTRGHVNLHDWTTPNGVF